MTFPQGTVIIMLSVRWVWTAGIPERMTGGPVLKKLNQWIDRFAYSHPRFGIPTLMLYIVIANAVTYILTLFAGAAALSFLEFDLYHVLHGEVWRLVTFVLLPFTYRPISLFIMLSFCYFVGGTLEREWGTAKFTLYYLSGMLFSVLSTVILSLATGYYGWSLSDAYYINLTMFLAFAVMYPDAQVWFYGVIPLKAKWLAWADIALMAWNIARSVRYGAYASALAAVVAILNFVIFFWEDIKSILGIQSRQRSRQTIQFKSAVRQQKKAETERGYRHKCEVCGRTDADHPELEFRYCSKCQGYHCFCSDHIFDHQHFTK